MMDFYKDTPLGRCIEDLGANAGWYNPMKIRQHIPQCMMFFIIGERRIGKTDYFLRLACHLWRKEHRQTMWLRNKKVELEDPGSVASFLNEAKLRGWCPDEWTTKSDGVYESGEKGAEKIIVFQSLSTFSNRRGAGEPLIDLFVLDEFMPEDGKYPKNCALGLLSLSKTVFSGRTDARIFCLSNIISAINPYFARYRVYPSREITVYKDKRILIEKCRGYRKAISDGNPWTDLYKSVGYGDYADEKEDPLITLVVPRVPKGAREEITIIRVENVNYKIYSHKGRVYFAEYKGQIPLSRYIIYTPNPDALGKDCSLLPKMSAMTIKEWVSDGTARFVGCNCMFDILNIVYNMG